MASRCNGGLKRWALGKFHYMREHLEIIGSTQGNGLFGKIPMIRQSAGNQISFVTDGRVGSSETTRGTLDCKDLHSLNLDPKFRDWFIGFAEGDGSFIVNKTSYLEFKITQASNDAQVLFYIKKSLGFGSVSIQDKKNKTHHFRVRDQKGILTLIHIFNGCLYTEKKNIQFEFWVKAFSTRYNQDITLIKNHKNPNLKSAWLAGFTDAEGCFICSTIKRSDTYNQVFVRYILSQQGEKELLEKIAQLFKGKLSYLKSYDGYNMTVHLSNLYRVISYFTLYPLKTKKHISFLNWLKVYKLVREKKHSEPAGLIQIKNLINKINKKF